MNPLAIVPLFVVTAVAEIAGCYLVYLWTRDERSQQLLLGAAVSLALFAWLLSFHPNAGRAYAAYGGVYVASPVAWGWLVEKNPPDRWEGARRRGGHQRRLCVAIARLAGLAGLVEPRADRSVGSVVSGLERRSVPPRVTKVGY